MTQTKKDTILFHLCARHWVLLYNTCFSTFLFFHKTLAVHVPQKPSDCSRTSQLILRFNHTTPLPHGPFSPGFCESPPPAESLSHNHVNCLHLADFLGAGCLYQAVGDMYLCHSILVPIVQINSSDFSGVNYSDSFLRYNYSQT